MADKASGRYSNHESRHIRHLIMPEIGTEGQERLRAGSVLVVGAGGLGSPVALYLAAAGVGHIGLVDNDLVELSNLQRQILHGEQDLGRPKAESGQSRLTGLDSSLRISVHTTRLDAGNAAEIIAPYAVVVGCVDNFEARYVLNAACCEAGKPNVFGSVSRFEGQASVFCVGDGPCYRCFFQDPPPEDWIPEPSVRGIASPVPGIIGSIQATETMKILLGIGRKLSGRLLLMDALTMRFREIPVARDPSCPVCSGRV